LDNFWITLLSIIAAATVIYTGYGTDKINLVIKTNGTDTYVTNESKLYSLHSQGNEAG
jgi:hypothetical protein